MCEVKQRADAQEAEVLRKQAEDGESTSNVRQIREDKRIKLSNNGGGLTKL